MPGNKPGVPASSGGSAGAQDKVDDDLGDLLPADIAGEDAAKPPADSATAYAQAQRDHKAVTLDYASRSAAAGGSAPPAATARIDYAPVAAPFQRLAVLITLVIVGLLLWVGKPILVPLAISVLLSFLLSPLCEWLERRRVPRVASVVLVVFGASLILFSLGYAVFNAIQQLGSNIDLITENLEKKMESLPFRDGGGTIGEVQEAIEKLEDAEDAASGDAGAVLDADPATGPATRAERAAATDAREEPAGGPGADASTADEPATQPVRGSDAELPIFVAQVPKPMSGLERAGYFLGIIAGPLGTAGLIIIFTLFVLLQRDDLRDRVITLAAGGQLNLATQALDDAATRISKYLVAQAVVNGSYGLAVGAGLQLIAFTLTGDGFPSVWLWALLCAALRFIPYLGPWLAAAFPIFVSLGYYEGYNMFLATAGYFVVIELLSNNVMEPILYGSSTGMSPVAVILAAAFWTFVWGPIGLLVATPITTCLVVLGKYVPALRFFDTLLGDEPVLAPDQRLYQRMLALDAEDAEDVIEEYRKDHTMTEAFDNVLLPALALAESDRHAGHLTVERIDFLRVAMRELVEEMSRQTEPIASDSVDLASASEPGAPAAPKSPIPALPDVRSRVVVIPSADAADKTAACMLKALLDRRGFDVTVLDEEELASEKLEQIFAQRADVVVISAVPPRAVSRARYLVKRLQQSQAQRGETEAGQGAATVIGLWTMQYDRKRAAERVRGEAAEVRVVTTMAEAVEEVRQRAQVVSTRRAAIQGP